MTDNILAPARNQSVRFTKYLKTVLPLDGFVFWVQADLLSPDAVYNGAAFNTRPYDAAAGVTPAAPIVQVTGSLHYTTEQRQDETASYAINKMVFTAEQPIQDLNAVSPSVMYIAERDGHRFAFSSRYMYSREARLYHYTGDAIYPLMASQIIDDAASLDLRNAVVSNSLPIWLTLNKLMPMYPSFLVDDNIVPPFASVHISRTRPLQAVPFLDRTRAHYQLAADTVRITTYGLRNDQALDFQDYVLGYIGYDGDPMGLMNMPMVQDEKKTQAEIGTLAQKKIIDFEVSYYQARVRDIARQLILSCVPTLLVDGGVNLVTA